MYKEDDIEPMEVDLDFPEEGYSGTSELIHLSDNLYVMAVCEPMGEAINFGDVIEVKHIGEDKYEFQRLIKKSDWIIEEWLLHPLFLISERGKQLIKTIVDGGGYWEVMMGGIFMFALPPYQQKIIEALKSYDCTFNSDLTSEEVNDSIENIYKQLGDDDALHINFTFRDFIQEIKDNL